MYAPTLGRKEATFDLESSSCLRGWISYKQLTYALWLGSGRSCSRSTVYIQCVGYVSNRSNEEQLVKI
jgi:hypothetical protein